jgi:hypothetical protein
MPPVNPYITGGRMITASGRRNTHYVENLSEAGGSQTAEPFITVRGQVRHMTYDQTAELAAWLVLYSGYTDEEFLAILDDVRTAEPPPITVPPPVTPDQKTDPVEIGGKTITTQDLPNFPKPPLPRFRVRARSRPIEDDTA